MKIKMGIIGYGCRGRSITKKVLFKMDDIEIVAVCDEYKDRAELAATEVEERYGKRPFTSTNYIDILDYEGIDAVYISTSWETHVEVAIDALKKKVPVALEVGGAYSLESLWKLVRTYEETKTPIMFMENCCFGKDELLATALVRKGVLGEVVHCHGAYGHYLCEEIAGGHQNRHYRLNNYLNRNADNYPTHQLGPIAKILNINRGNRMVSLVSVASKAAGMKEYIGLNKEKYPELQGKTFMQGDIVNTIITCADGSTISLRLDTTLPRHYSREFTVRGTKGMYEQGNNFVYVLGDEESGYVPIDVYKKYGNNGVDYEKEYLPAVWKNISAEQLASGHGGMDSIVFRVFVDCLKDNKPMPIDVYDAASLMCITVLSEASIAAGGMPQVIPDFTEGMWLRRKPEDVVEI